MMYHQCKHCLSYNCIYDGYIPAKLCIYIYILDALFDNIHDLNRSQGTCCIYHYYVKNIYYLSFKNCTRGTKGAVINLDRRNKR